MNKEGETPPDRFGPSGPELTPPFLPRSAELAEAAALPVITPDEKAALEAETPAQRLEESARPSAEEARAWFNSLPPVPPEEEAELDQQLSRLHRKAFHRPYERRPEPSTPLVSPQPMPWPLADRP